MNLNGIDIAIVILCPVIVALIGLVTSKYQDKTTAKGYFLASGKMPWFIIGAAFVSTSVSSEQMVGTNGAGYAFGMRIANWEWFALSYIPLIIFFIPVYLKNHIITVPQFLERRYGPWCANVYSWVMLLAYIFIFMVPTLYGGGLAFSRLTGWNFYLILWLKLVTINTTINNLL